MNKLSDYTCPVVVAYLAIRYIYTVSNFGDADMEHGKCGGGVVLARDTRLCRRIANKWRKGQALKTRPGLVLQSKITKHGNPTTSSVFNAL